MAAPAGGRFLLQRKPAAGWISYWIRNACTGSIEAARRAGTNPATKAQNPKAAIAPPRITGLKTPTP